MNVMICGASGFVGRHLSQAVKQAGYHVVAAVRNPSGPRDIAADFRHDITKQHWIPRLENIDVVINAVGVLRDSPENPMQRLHHDTPLALFAACVDAGVKRIVHISALGIESGIHTAYFTTRMAAEEALRNLPAEIQWLCLRPSVIYGEDGASARMFRMLAKLPLQALPMGGKQELQPVHIDDICTAVKRWLADEHANSGIVEAVGAEPTTMRGMLDSYRQQSGLGSAWHVAVPEALVRLAARVGDHLPASPLCSDTVQMMAAANTADAGAFAGLLGHAPKSYREFIA